MTQALDAPPAALSRTHPSPLVVVDQVPANRVRLPQAGGVITSAAATRACVRNARNLLGRFVARDAERLAVVGLVAAARAQGPDGMRVPADRQPLAPPGVVRRARLPHALAAPTGPLERRAFVASLNAMWLSGRSPWVRRRLTCRTTSVRPRVPVLR